MTNSDSPLERAFTTARQTSAKREWFSYPIDRTAGEAIDGPLDALLSRLESEATFLERFGLKARRTAYWVILDHAEKRSFIKIGRVVDARVWHIETERANFSAPIAIDDCLEAIGEILEFMVREKTLKHANSTGK